MEGSTRVSKALHGRGTAAIVAATAAALLLWAAPAGAGSPKAKASGEELITYLTKGKLKPGKRIAYQVVCAADCELSATSTLVLKGPNLGPVTAEGQFPAGQVAESFLKPNKPARSAIKSHLGSSKLRTSVTATNVLTGETDTDRRTFRFKR
jgi:hypothetical protein